MPTGDVHGWLCSDWGIRCRFPNASCCPLDEPAWKGIHHPSREWLIPYDEDSDKFVRAVLELLEPHFAAFRSELPQLTDNEARLCWKAHLVADHASDCWWELAGHPKGKFRDFYKSRADYRQFMRDLASRII